MTKSSKLVGMRIADRYCITGQIGKGGMGVVFRAIPFDDPSHSVAIKVIQRSGKLGYDDLMRFQKEASLMSQLHHPNIVVFHELGLFGNDNDEAGDLGTGYYIVMEIADGDDLKESLERDGRKDLAFFFQIGLQVSAALDYTHGKNIIHRDIKPHNIIVGQAWRDQRGVAVKVLDFGVARLAEAMHYGGDRDVLENRMGADDAAGTPLYMAPEQTPLMNAPVDHRVDLYSLGCVLYEILVGKPPFTARSREKLEKAHVFAELERLTNLRPDVPKVIEKIVHKLLAKHPDDRYQTAFALHADLMRAKTLFDKAGQPQGINFPLGLKDSFQAVSAQLKLVGRDEEISALIKGYDAVATEKGRSRLSLIKGAAGIGKTRLMNEFRANLQARKVRFVSGSFSQHENALPFNALANAFNEYLHRILKSHPHEAEELRRRFKQTIGDMAYNIAEIVPGLKPFLYERQSESDEEDVWDVMNNEEDFNRFAKAFSDFTRCLGTDNQPVVFLFDDLHWADEKSLQLIDTFFTNANTLQFYLVISERTGLHIENDRFTQLVEKFKKLRRRFLEIELHELDAESTKEIIANMLSSKRSADEQLSAHLYNQCKGNPMHLVELTRTLVSRDLIFRESQEHTKWSYNLAALQKTQIQLNTIDLILSRIQNFQEFDRQVLGIAATVGLTFQFEILLLGGRTQSVPVMKAIQRAMDEGLLVRVTDDPDLKHLGKTFFFAHKKARDAIYESITPDRRRMMHRAIGEKLEAAIPEPTEKILFALAHHFNSAMDDGRAEDVELAKRALKHNTLAGKAAYTSGSWHTAERYFENAADIMKQWGTQVASLEDEARVAETLADLSAAQKNHGKALRVYRQLLSKRLPVDMHAAIAYKAIYFQLVGGIMSDTSRLINQTLTFMRRAIPKVSPVQKFIAVWHIILDVLPGDRRKKRLQQLLGLAHALRKHNSEELDRKTPAIKLYLAGSALHLRDNWWLALIFHTYALKMGLKGRGSPTNLIKMVADRGALLGYLGFHKTAYHLFDLSMDVARACRLKEVYGYVALSRMLTLDYIKGRTEEVGDHLKEAMYYIGPNQDRLSYGLGICFKIYRELVRCNFTVVYKMCQYMPDVIPTRNWMSPRSIAMMLFGYLLQGSRDNIVLHGEMFLKRRAKVAGRSNDIFITVIKSLISFARGEIDKTRESFIQTMQEFIESKQKEFLYPFEEDFIGIFAFTFPVLFEQEYGRHLMRVNEMQTLLVALRKRVKKIKGQDREVPLLLLARANEMLGNSRPIRGQYDAALRHARVTNNNIVQIFAYAWFGIHLTEAGQQKKDYIRRAFILAQKYDLKAIMTYTRKIMEQRGIYLKEAQLINTSHTSTQTGAVQHGITPSPLFVENLNHVCDAVESEVGLEEDLEESFKILAKHYAAARTMCFFTAGVDGQVKVIYPAGTQASEAEIIDYISPYFNIRSTLYLPMNDAPWHRAESDADNAQSLSFTDDEETAQEQPFNGESTIVVEQSSTMDMDATIVESTGIVNDQSDRAATVRNAGDAPVRVQGNLAMSALVPLRSDFDSLGVIFLENVSNLHGRDSTVTRHELDQFGAQIGILVERKIRDNVRSPETSYLEESCKATYQPASFTLEKPDWLKVWSHGRLRAQRETTWYLGLSLGKDHYMVAYCSLTGDEYVRDRLSSMLWHHMYVVRAQCVAAGRSRIELSDLREELSGLFAAVPRASTLDSIAVSFTIFNKNDQVAVSGHYGPSRPFVVGTENVVTPYNEVILQFSSGRDLRYWEVAASLADPHAYILSYDTSKIDQAPVDTLQKQVAESIAFASGEEEMHQALCSLVAEEHLPRYYVAAVMRDESQEDVKSEPEDSEDEDAEIDQKLDRGA